MRHLRAADAGRVRRRRRRLSGDRSPDSHHPPVSNLTLRVLMAHLAAWAMTLSAERWLRAHTQWFDSVYRKVGHETALSLRALDAAEQARRRRSRADDELDGAPEMTYGVGRDGRAWCRFSRRTGEESH